MQQIFRMKDAAGNEYDVPNSDLAEFSGAVKDAQPVNRYRDADGNSYDVPASDIQEFRAAVPSHEQVRTMTFADGSKRDFTLPELDKFLRSKEWREGEAYKADRDERDRIVADRVSDGKTSDTSFLEEYSKGLADSGGTAIGRTLGGALSRFSKFTGWLAANARPMGTEGALTSREFHPEEDEAPSTTDTALPMRRYKGSAGRAISGEIEKATDILYPEAPQTDSAVAQGIGKAIGLGAGLAEFSLTPTAILSGGHFVEGWEQAYDAAKARGATDEEATTLGLVRGGTDAAITTAFKKAPVHRIVGALGYKPSPAVLEAIAKAGEKGIAGVNRGSVATAIGKQMLANAAISAMEMGSLGGLQSFIDDAVMQEAEKGEIDWNQSWKTFGNQALEQGTFGAVMGLLPTPVKVREAVKQRDAILRETLADPMGVVAYARANPEAGKALADAWRKDGKVSRRVAREAGLPEMDEVSRNNIGETIALYNDFEARPRPAPESRGGEPPLAPIPETPKQEATNETRNGADEAPAKPAEGTAGEPKVGEAADAKAAEPPRAEAPREGVVEPPAVAEPPKTPQEPSAEAGQAKETPTAEKPPEAVSAAPDAAPIPDGKGKMKKRKGKKAKAEEPPPPAEEQTAPAETAATESLRETIRTDPELLRIDAAWKTAKTDAERNALKARFDARVEEIKAAQTQVKPTERAEPDPLAPGNIDDTLAKWDAERRESANKVKLSSEAIADIKDWMEKNPDGDFTHDGMQKIFDAEMERVKAANGGVRPMDVMPTLDAISVAYKDMKAASRTEAEGPSTYTPAKELVEAKDRIEAMPTDSKSQKDAKKKAQKDWLLSSVDDAIKSHAEAAAPEGAPSTEKFVDDYEALLKRRNATYDRKKLGKIHEQIDKARETFQKGEMITFDVPDNGTFKVYNNPEALTLFKRLVQKRLSPTSLKEGTIVAAEKPLANDIETSGVGEKVAEGEKPAAAPKAEGDKRLKSVNPEGDLPDIPDLDAKTPEQEITERLDLKRLDPKRRSDPKVLSWARKNGRNITNGMVTPDAVRAYDETMTENTGRLAKRWFPDTKIVAHKFGEKIKRGVHVIDLRDTAGNTIGWFDPKSKEFHLLPGADPKTVAHEIMWHGTRDYISQLAAKGDARAQKWLDMMHDVERNAPQQIKDIVNRLYARAGQPVSADTLMNEYGAWFTMGKGGAALEKALQKAENRNWFAKAFYTVKEMFKDFLTAHGKNRVDLAAIDGMTRDEFVDFLSKEFAGGKTLGHIKGPQQPMISTKETFLGKYKRRVYDQNAAVRDLERDVEKKTGKKISADNSVEAANALKHGLKEAANIEIQGKMAEFRKTLSETGIHHADLEYYAALKAAAGRDAKIDARNIANLKAKMGVQGKSQAEIDAAVNAYKSTNGSHIDPREAKKMLAEIENGPDAAKYKQAYDAMRKVIDETLDIQQQAGLVSAEEVKQWRAEEPNYIPFKNEYDAETGEWLGRGTSRNFTAPEHHAAKGRQSAAGDILAHIFMDHQLAKHRAIENAVRQKLAALVKANPELGKVEILPKDAVRNVEKDDPNVVVFKQNGRAYAIHLEGTRGAAVANAFTQRNQWKMDWADKGFQVYGKKISFRNFAHWSAGMATRYSPTFALRNTLKDNIELANIIYSERGPIEGSKWMAQYAMVRAATLKNVANAITGHKLGINGDTIGAALGKYITTGKIDTSTNGGKMLDRYIKAGGLIAGGTRAEAFSTIKDSLTPEAIAKEMKRGNSKIRAIGKHALNSIAYLNEYAEMATRLGIFSTEVKAGKSDAEAALFSRRATVDFNRHGDWTPGFNLFRLFSNSTLGATARAAAALTKSKYGAVAGASMFAWGLGRVFLDHFANADEDKERAKLGKATGKDMSEYDRRTSLFYLRRGDNLYKVAQHESPFSLITYAGDCVGRWILGEIDGKQVAKNLGVSAAEVAYNFLPMGSVNLTSRNGGFTDDMKAALVSGVCPTVLQPIAELAWNMDYAGRTIYNEPYPGDTSPRSSQGRDSTPDWAKDAAVKLNEATRKDDELTGYVDVPPEAIQKMLEGYGKNAMRDISMALSLGEAIAKGDLSMLDPRNTPIKRDFVRPLDGNDARFNEARKEFKAKTAFIGENGEEMPDAKFDEFIKKNPYMEYSDDLKSLVSDIAKLRKMEKGFDYEKGKAVPVEWTQEEIDGFKAQRRKLQAEFLKEMGKQ